MQDAGFERPASLPHSRLGIASFAVSLAGTLIFCIAFAIAFSLGFSSGGAVNPSSPAYALATVTMCGSVFVSLVGLGLGIGSLFQAQYNKTFGIVGLVLGALVLCVYGVLTVIGLSAMGGL